MQPTFKGSIKSDLDARMLVEACLLGYLSHLPRKPYETEWSSLLQAGHVYIFEENASGFRSWDDGFYCVSTASTGTVPKFQTVPLRLKKIAISFSFNDTIHHLIAYQPLEEVGTSLERPSTNLILRDINPRKELRITSHTSYNAELPSPLSRL